MKNPNIAALVGRVLAGKTQIYTEADRARLESMSECTLVALATIAERDVELAAATPAPVTTPATPAALAAPSTPATPAALSDAEYIAAMPAGVRETFAAAKRIVDEAAARDARDRTVLIGALKSAQTVYNEAALTAKPTDELRALAELVGIDNSGDEPIDFAGRGVASISANAEGSDADVYLKPGDPYNLAGLEAAREARTRA